LPQLKQMEMQLEEEYEDKQKVLREKRELESKLSAVSDQVGHRAPCGGGLLWHRAWHGPSAAGQPEGL